MQLWKEAWVSFTTAWVTLAPELPCHFYRQLEVDGEQDFAHHLSDIHKSSGTRRSELGLLRAMPAFTQGT